MATHKKASSGDKMALGVGGSRERGYLSFPDWIESRVGNMWEVGQWDE